MSNREQRFHEIDNKINKMSSEEKYFALWLLLKEYRE